MCGRISSFSGSKACSITTEIDVYINSNIVMSINLTFIIAESGNDKRNDRRNDMNLIYNGVILQHEKTSDTPENAQESDLVFG
jgi:hypothetical protein